MMWIIFLTLGLITNQFCLTSGLSDESYQESTGFMDRVRNWFSKIKDKIFGRYSDEYLPPIDVETFKDITENEQKAKFIQFGNLFVDLSTVTFDPEQDWGFRIGNWYIIKKNSIDASVAPPEDAPEEPAKLTML